MSSSSSFLTLEWDRYGDYASSRPDWLKAFCLFVLTYVKLEHLLTFENYCSLPKYFCILFVLLTVCGFTCLSTHSLIGVS